MRIATMARLRRLWTDLRRPAGGRAPRRIADAVTVYTPRYGPLLLRRPGPRV